MSPLARILADEIRRDGPIPFRRFMQAALYHIDHGYYRKPQDPFGVLGDFYTAEQLQPVFGVLIAQRIRMLFEEMGQPADFIVAELGAGRGEMRDALSGFRYVPVEVEGGRLPDKMCGVIFSNEFFDALPVDRVVWRRGKARELLVACEAERFVWTLGEPAGDEIAEYVERYLPPLEDGATVEVNRDALRWIERIAQSLESGFHFTIDYGYTRREAVRFPNGSLMSYRRHAAIEEVLSNPGEQDITAHVNFTALSEHGRRCGLETMTLESLARTLLTAGEADQFHEALAAGSSAAGSRRRLQLKTLLFGMGETFRTLWQRKAGGESE